MIQQQVVGCAQRWMAPLAPALYRPGVDQTPIYDELLDQLLDSHVSAAAGALPRTPGNPSAIDLFGTAPGGRHRAHPAGSASACGRRDRRPDPRW
ncbi:MAG: hypothetical protein M3O70_07560 [Actinomycetota bacterium]|nr:hypothetical protein [Actinomycetota bacterium]